MDRSSADMRQPKRAVWRRIPGLLFAAAIFSASQLAAGAAFADAKLIRVEGTVLVNTGEGYQAPVQPMALKSGARMIQVDGPMSLKAGDRIMLRKRSSAELHYADGCRVPLVAGQFFTISRLSPCAVKACTPGAAGCAVLANSVGTGVGTGTGLGTGLGAGLGAGTLTTIATVAGTGLAAGAAGAIVASTTENNGGGNNIEQTFSSP